MKKFCNKKFITLFISATYIFLAMQAVFAVPTCEDYVRSLRAQISSRCATGTMNPNECNNVDAATGLAWCEWKTDFEGACVQKEGVESTLCLRAKNQNQCSGGCPGESEQLGPQQTQFEPIVPRLQINIPTLKPFNAEDVKLVGEPPDRYVVVPFIAQYIIGIYKYAASFAFVISVVLVMVAGFRWMTSGGNASIIGQAKSMIAQTSIGLLLLLGSYVLLNTVNPDLVKTGVLKIKYVERELFEPDVRMEEGATEGELPPAAGNCSNPSFVISSIDGVDISLKNQVQSLLANKDKYMAAARVAGVPWEMIATVHKKEANGNLGRSALNGGELCNTENNANLLNFCPECRSPSVENDLICAGKLLKQKVGSLNQNTTDISAVKLAFCKYNGCGSAWQSCPEASPYVGPLFDANHRNYTKQVHDCVPARCETSCVTDATKSPRTPKGCCAIKIFAAGQKPSGFTGNACSLNHTSSCVTAQDSQTATYSYKPVSTAQDACGVWTEQKRIGALTIYALLKKSQ